MTLSTQQERTGVSLQLGIVKYLYTGYFVAGCVVAWLSAHLIDVAWGEGHEQVTALIGVATGVGAVAWGWKNTRLRTLAMETIDELAAVTWPSKQETYTATTVVITTAILASVIIFGLDRFWNWFTDFIYLKS